MHLPLYLAENSLLPDKIIRFGIKQQLKAHSKRLYNEDYNDEDWIKFISNFKLAYGTEESKEQHYEVPSAYFINVLGSNLKYSCCDWSAETKTLTEAESSALKNICDKANVIDGQKILELGCGWGSLSLYLAEHFPNSNITAVSHSSTQREFIKTACIDRNLSNLEVITTDINNFETPQKFDLVVSIEMFEHLRNYISIFSKIHNWLTPSGKLFVHIFNHKNRSYLFQDERQRDWMARNFFTEGMMPSASLLPKSATQFDLEKHWIVNGTNYSKTLESWLKNHDNKKLEIYQIFKSAYKKEYKLWYQKWRIFYMACSELFNYNDGKEWFVSHYLFNKK